MSYTTHTTPPCSLSRFAFPQSVLSRSYVRGGSPVNIANTSGICGSALWYFYRIREIRRLWDRTLSGTRICFDCFLSDSGGWIFAVKYARILQSTDSKCHQPGNLLVLYQLLSSSLHLCWYATADTYVSLFRKRTGYLERAWD